MPTPPRDKFIAQLAAAIDAGAFAKLTLGKYRGPDASLRNVHVRPVTLKAGPHLAILWRHATGDITKNHPPAEALSLLRALIGTEFLHAHLFAGETVAQLECEPDGRSRLRITAAPVPAPVSSGHDREKQHLIPLNAPWLRDLGVTNQHGQVREGMADKYRQIQKFAEIFQHLTTEAGLGETEPLQIADMGSGKGYLTFALAGLLGDRGVIRGIESRSALVETCNLIARKNQFSNLRFTAGQIDALPRPPAAAKLDVLIALHACDTATDDALAHGLNAGARLLVVSPCCQKELRPQLTPPAVLSAALRHGIFQERQAEFVTDALRALILEWAGYRTKVFEFISTEHTAKNLMISAIKSHAPADPARAASARAFAAFYGIRTHRLAGLLGLSLDP
jgi:hypothetical protein